MRYSFCVKKESHAKAVRCKECKGFLTVGDGSVLFSEVGREDVEFFAVFGDGAAGDFHAFVVDHLYELLVAERFECVFIVDELF